jgi:hypothetical protein
LTEEIFVKYPLGVEADKDLYLTLKKTLFVVKLVEAVKSCGVKKT